MKVTRLTIKVEKATQLLGPIEYLYKIVVEN